MKKQSFILLLFCISSVALFASAAVQSSSGEPKKTQSIDLEGKFKTGNPRSGGGPIMAWLIEEGVEVLFHCAMGAMDISITNAAGMEVYTATVNTTAQPYLSICLQGMPQGVYIISFSNESGMMYGEFEL